jgi:lysophospholipase L1-like esterase
MTDRRLSIRLRRGLVVASCLLLGTCKSPTTPTPPPPPPELTVSCPANQSALSHFNQPVKVSWPDPTSAGGIAPVIYICAPPSGSEFTAGNSAVQCTALDAYNRRAICTFEVSVVRPPQLQVTRFVAFGDSLTEGKMSLASSPMVLFTFPEAYPSKLQGMLTARYTDQTFTVVDEGLGGEKTAEGVLRLPGVLAANHPEVLLLQEGANDLIAGLGAIPRIISSLETMIRMAQGQGIRVYLANQPPQRAGGLRAGGAAYVVPLNQQLVGLAQRDGVPLVDVYTALNAALDANIGWDGLHPTAQGYEVMAQAFFDSIRTTLEPRTGR